MIPSRHILNLFVTKLLLLLSCQCLWAEKTKIVCFGDSITNAGYPHLLAPLLGAETVNAGVGGNNTVQGLKRIQKDVLDHEPDIVIIFFGTNDLRVDSKKEVPIPEYKKNLTAIAEKVRETGAKILFCTLPPINHEPYFTRHEAEIYGGPEGLAKLVSDYRSAALAVAKELEAPIVDLNQLLLEKPNWMRSDGVHPSKTGSAIIAELIAEEVKPLMPSQPAEPAAE